MDVGLVRLVGCWMLHSCDLMDDGCCGYGLYMDLCDIYVDFCYIYIYVLWLLRYMRQSGKNNKKHISQLSKARTLAAKILALPTAPGGGCR
jgi:hypothetical protein